MTKFDYSALDAAILTATAETPRMFSYLLSVPQISAEASRFAARDSFRVLDRRLQALRKAGRMSYSSKTGWLKA